ncbi:MAG: hemerythrin domain-containing protein [Phenylobacterium sp.]|uniref:hemerythrin domain-containing protein n=1 Tax=Phenylobacterium sp. TaxID=1871053 RepID=UPI0025F23E5B|nr:hemerythrin domain-containing protein [Phenylobacterium sp.]MBI1196327.1 hemerythrin domain-containing protein [Phenylobacterium sp.]
MSAPQAGITPTGRASARPDDAVTPLINDHREAKDLFKQYEAAKGDNRKKQAIYRKIAAELRIHMRIEEEIFYPASRKFVGDEGMVNEAEVEHASAKDLMDQLDGLEPSDPYFDAKVTVLSEMIDHHVEEEETEYFPECRRSTMDLKAIGEQMKTRKAELKAAH